MWKTVLRSISAVKWPGSKGSASVVLAIALALNVSVAQLALAQSLVVLHSFGGGTDGLFPSSGVIRDAQGNLYGTTLYGGVYNLGTVFKISGRGKETVLHSFAANSDGAVPNWGLVRDSTGNLYGTTVAGGNLTCNNGMGCGTVFKLDTTNKESVLHSFAGSPDGNFPSGVIRDSLGNLYGTTQGGGATTNDIGTVYKLDVTGKETVLYSFTGGSIGAADGAAPFGPPVRDLQGNLYGTTVQGGPNNFGTVYKVNAAGSEVILYSFAGGVDGGYPNGGLIRDSAGNLYGTTTDGGASTTGTVFKVSQTSAKSILYSFGWNPDAQVPMSGLIQDSAGNLYGTTELGGEYGWGTVYRLDAAGNETVLYSFTGGVDGQYALGVLARDAAGNLYGTTQRGGTYGFGTVFKLKP